LFALHIIKPLSMFTRVNGWFTRTIKKSLYKTKTNGISIHSKVLSFFKTDTDILSHPDIIMFVAVLAMVVLSVIHLGHLKNSYVL